MTIFCKQLYCFGQIHYIFFKISQCGALFTKHARWLTGYTTYYENTPRNGGAGIIQLHDILFDAPLTSVLCIIPLCSVLYIITLNYPPAHVRVHLYHIARKLAYVWTNAMNLLKLTHTRRYNTLLNNEAYRSYGGIWWGCVRHITI